MKLIRSLIALSALCLPIVSYANTISGTLVFSDTSPARNNLYNFTGTFEQPNFSFPGIKDAMFKDKLTIDTYLVRGKLAGSYDNLSVAVNFTEPDSKNSDFSGTGSAYFLGIIGGSVIEWVSNYQTVTFSDGSSVGIYLPDFVYGASIFGPYGSHEEYLTMTVLTEATPEPSSFALLGAGLLCLASLAGRKFLTARRWCVPLGTTFR